MDGMNVPINTDPTFDDPEEEDETENSQGAKLFAASNEIESRTSPLKWTIRPANNGVRSMMRLAWQPQPVRKWTKS